MALMDHITDFLGILKDALGIPMVISDTISEGVSAGISGGISRNKKWVEQGAIRFALFFLSLFFFCFGLSEISDSLLPQLKGIGALFIGLILALAALFMQRQEPT